MFNKFLQGLAIGAGFGIAFTIVAVTSFYFIVPAILKSNFSEPEVIVSVPPLEPPKRFLGSSGIYTGGFTDNKKGVLPLGPGRIVGGATANDKPVAGLKVRLALNGSVMSQWGITDKNGKYEISVPYGKYRIDGYELDMNSANSALPNKIDHPQIAHSSSDFEVSEDSVGYGLNLKFTDPIIKDISKKRFSMSEDVVIRWQPYSGASQYSVQLYDKSDPHEYYDNKTLFGWSERPTVTDTFIKLKEYKVDLKPGHYYAVEIEARDDHRRVISRTARTHSDFDFEVIK